MVSVFMKKGHLGDYVLGERTLLGRSNTENEIGINIPSYIVSRLHGEFNVHGANIYYQDLGSTNGTWLNGMSCQETVAIRPEDILTIIPKNDFEDIPECVLWVNKCPYGMHFEWSNIPLDETVNKVVVGRKGADGPMTKDLYMSRIHGEFYRSTQGWVIKDLQSFNGIYVNGDRISGFCILKPMDLIRIGSACFIFLGNQLVRGVLTDDVGIQGIGIQGTQGSDINNQRQSDGDRLKINIIEKKVSVGFRKKTLLKDINMTVHPGEMILILGGSGAGKTTFMNAVIGYESAKGSVKYGNLDVFKEYNEVKYQIGYVPQQDLLRLQDTVYDTLYAAAEMKMPGYCSPEDYDNRVNWAIELLGLAKERDTLAQKLSGGQRKRLSIAIELVGDPALVFLDEPDSGLDGIMARTLMENLRTIADLGKIVMVISHGPDRAAELFDKVMVLAKGTADQCGHLVYYGDTKDAYSYFNVDNLEGIVRKINREDEGGEGMGDALIERWANLRRR